MVPILLISIAVRAVAFAWSLMLVRRLRDWRIGFLSALLVLMATRQVLTLREHLAAAPSLDRGSWSELPGLAVSFLVLLAVTLLGRVVLELQEGRERLQRVTRYHRALLENASDAIHVTDAAGRIRYMSPSIMDRVGRRPSDYVGTDMWQWIHPDDQAAARAALDEVRAQPNGVARFSGRGSHPDGSWRDVEAILTNLLDDDAVRGVVVATRDVTARRRQEAVLREREMQLAHAERLGALGTLAGGVAHDFNNVLGAIVGHADLALAAAPGAAIDDHLREVLAAADRGSNLVRQILLFGRGGDQPHRPLHLAAVVGDAARLMRAALPSSIRIHQDIATARDVVDGDPDQLHRVVVNLCTNAGYAMRDGGGTLEVRLEPCDVTVERPCPVGTLQPGAYLRLRIQDTGTGIAPDVLAHVFEPFFSTKPRHEIGCGLGLAAVAGIVIAHDGAIAVTSPPDRGATFEVFLPQTDRAVETVTPASPAAPPGQGRVLLVDDEPAQLDVGRRMIEILGYDVTGFRSGTAALAAFSACPEGVAAVVTDQTMPGMSGAALAAAVLRISPETPVILCTGFSERFTATDAAALGVHEYIPKPVRLARLAEALSRARAHHRERRLRKT